MATRLISYQKSVKNYILNRSLISKSEIKNLIYNQIQDDNFILPITLLTIMNGQQKKNKLKLTHGYEIASGIELLIVITQILQIKKKIIIKPKFELIDSTTITMLIPLINLSFMHSIELFTIHQKPETTIRLITEGYKQLNQKIYKIFETIKTFEIPIDIKNDKKTDLYNFHFQNPNIFEKLSQKNFLSHDFLMKYIDDIYGNLSTISVYIGWIIGGSSLDCDKYINLIGRYLGILLKLEYDFTHIEEDAQFCIENNFTLNYVINMGLQKSFELFDDSKKKLNEYLLILKITSTTIKEFIDVLDKNINFVLENSSPNLKCTSSISATI